MSCRHAEWFRDHRHELSKAGLGLRGGELNTLPLDERDRRPLRVLLARLSSYDDTGESFTHQILYQIAADTEGVFPDLAYLPQRADERVLRRDGVPWLLGSATKDGPEAFDVLGLSNAIVQELVNVPTLLRRSGVPLGKRERLERADVPLVLLGGANALYTSALWNDDPWVDGVFVGEDDRAVRRLLEIARDGKRDGLDKRAVLAAMEQVPGFLQPDRPRATRKAFAPDLARAAALERGPVPHLVESLGTAHLQISEGCPCFCSFCAESWDRKPYRERRLAVALDAARRMKAHMGLSEIELYSFNFNMHSDLSALLWELAPLFSAIGLKSQRFDLLAHDPEMVALQHALGKASLTCGLEGISPRLRRYLHKNLENADLHDSLTAILGSRARALKVFLIATGLEEEQDFLAFGDLVGHMAALRRDLGVGTRVTFSMTPLVRFPWTPLEFEDAPDPERLRPILERTAAIVRAAGFEFRASADLAEAWLSQVLVRADDPRVGAALLDALDATGFVYRREVPDAFRAAFERALSARGLAPADLLRGHDAEAGARKPWTLVDTGVKRDFLWQEVERARAFVEIDYCLGREWTRAKCFRCGGCPTPQHVLAIVRARQERDYGVEDFLRRLADVRAAERTVDLVVDVGEAAWGLPRKAVGVALARALMLSDAELVDGQRGFVASRWTGRGEDAARMLGEDVLTLRFDGPALARLRERLVDPAFVASVDAHLGDWGRLLGEDDGSWAPASFEVESPFAFRPEKWLERNAVGLSLRRTGEGRYTYDVSAKARKRDVVRALSFERVGAGTRVALVPGRRFDWQEFLERAFALPHRADVARLRARCVGPRAPTPAAE